MLESSEIWGLTREDSALSSGETIITILAADAGVPKWKKN